MKRHVLNCKVGGTLDFHPEMKKILKSKQDDKTKQQQQTCNNNISRSRKKRYAKCLMCLHWFCGAELEKHLWICKAKRACLNRIHVIEIKTEVQDGIKTEVQDGIKTEVHDEINTEILSEIKTEVQDGVNTEVLGEIKAEVLSEIKTEVLCA